jgi:zeaxanthin glucosyltransferase
MATIGIVAAALPGHLLPIGALGRALARRGHRVIAATLPDGEPLVRASGLEFAAIGAAEYPPGAMERVTAELGRLRGRAAFRHTIELGLALTRVVLRDAPEVLRPRRPDLLVVDQALPGGNTLAERLGVPFVSVAAALPIVLDLDVPPNPTPWGPARSGWGRVRNRLAFEVLRHLARPVVRLLAEQRRAWGLSRRDDPRDWPSPLAQIWQQPREFEFPCRLPPHVHCVGPLTDPSARPPVPFPFEALEGRPLVYASLGTLQNRLPHVFRAIAAACAGRDVQLVLSLGGSADPATLGPLPGRPLVVWSAPQLELLDRAAVTITHAGLNTTLESLARGVPLVAIPITNDQPGVAARIAWTGSGRVVPAGLADAARLRRAVDRVLEDPGIRRDAGLLRDAIARAGGVGRASALVERVLETGGPGPAG